MTYFDVRNEQARQLEELLTRLRVCDNQDYQTNGMPLCLMANLVIFSYVQERRKEKGDASESESEQTGKSKSKSDDKNKEDEDEIEEEFVEEIIEEEVEVEEEVEEDDEPQKNGMTSCI